MRRLPGKIVAMLFLPWLLFASGVHIDVDKKEVVRGDTVTFSVTAEGEKVEFPVLTEIDGFPILGTSQRSSISIVNGHTTKSFTKSYTFAPMRDVTIPPLEVKVDGTLHRTDAVKITVTDRPKGAVPGAEAVLKIEVDKRNVHVGEPIAFEVLLRYRRRANFVQVELASPEFSNFWIKKLGDVEKSYDGDFVVEKQRYLIFPQKAGDYRLGPLTAKIAKRVRTKPPISDPFFDDDFFNGFFARLQWSRIASNTLDIHVDPLPGGVQLYGNFTIRAKADRTVVDADQPVRVTIEIEGEGNIDDIEKFEPHIPDAVVYSDDPVVREWVKEGRYGGSFKETITIVADHDFTVPSFVLRYYDSGKRRIVEKRTSPIRIKVKGGRKIVASAQTSLSQTAGGEKHSGRSETDRASSERKPQEGTFPGWLYLLAGLLTGAGAMYGYGKLGKLSIRKKESDIVRSIRRAKNDRELMDLLLPYAREDEEIKEALEKLEENLYGEGRHKVDRAWLADIVEDLEHRSESRSSGE
ncbi:BatD family protein [Hydrogenimonas sp.]